VQKDFAPISQIADQPLFVVINATVPAASIRELIALARAKPESLRAGYTQLGSATHLATEIIKLKSNTVKSITSVSYKGGGAVQIALISNEIQISVMTATSMLPQLGTGKVKVVATLASKRVRTLPDVPTLDESGITGIEMSAWQGLLAPAGTPQTIIRTLHAEIVKLLKRPEILDRLGALGGDAVGSSPAEFAAKLARELKEFARVIPTLGLTQQ
jgi:tripartite-type tricarboxylate transporter receptor subunit TctC